MWDGCTAVRSVFAIPYWHAAGRPAPPRRGLSNETIHEASESEPMGLCCLEHGGGMQEEGGGREEDTAVYFSSCPRGGVVYLLHHRDEGGMGMPPRVGPARRGGHGLSAEGAP